MTRSARRQLPPLPRAVLFAFLVCALFRAAPPAVAASFALPENSAIEVRAFTFPPGPDADAAERGLPENFRDRLVFALQRAGFTVGQSPAPLVITPLRDEGRTAPGETVPEETAESASDISEETVPEETAPEETAEGEQPAEAVPHPWYILAGRVTLFRENVGAPMRIAGDIRIRTEASMHCTYQITEAATGKVIISDALSESAASVAAQTRDLDAALAKLTDKALAAAAAKIALRLSGVATGDENDANDREEYQDSPGKRLKPETGP